MDFAKINKMIEDAFPALSPQLQIAAKHVLDRPDDVALMSMRSLASHAGVHPSTMVRLAKSFGLNSYQEFRAPFQQRLRARPEGYLSKARTLQARSLKNDASITQEVLAANISNLQQTFDINAPERFKVCAKVINKACKVYIVGMRGVFPIAYFFHYAYSMFRDNAVLLDGRGGAFSDGLRGFGSDDVILAISFSPYTLETVRAIDYAKARGGKVIVISDSPVSPLARGADELLVIKNESPSFYHSVAAGVTVAEELITLLVVDGGKAALNAIEESERQLEIFNAYWHQNTSGKRRRRGDIRTVKKP